jgi:acyl carrier protein phosphodiesterase
MNFLAHAYLSGNNEEILTGNFMADFIKGKRALQNLPPGLAKGVELHRLIDSFTDEHPIVHESKRRLRVKYRHYAGVIVDVFYDHFLANDWHLYHTDSLQQYSSRVYQIVETFHSHLPAEMKEMLYYMKRGNWLLNYADMNGIAQALSGMSRRTTFASKMEEAIFELRQDRDAYHQEFKVFFPELTIKCEQWLKDQRIL